MRKIISVVLAALLFITLLTFAAGWVLSELLKLPEKIRHKSSKKK